MASTSPPTKREDWWFEDGNVVIQAGDRLFKLHMSNLARESDFFKDLSSLPPPTGEAAEGTEKSPLLLHEVEADVFADLLHVLYLRWGQPLTQSTAQLEKVLRAAHRYQFTRVCDIATPQIKGTLETLPELELAIACGSDEWIQGLFATVVLGFDDIAIPSTLSPSVAAKVWKARLKVASYRLRHMTQIGAQTVPYMSPAPGGHIYSIQKICDSHLKLLVNFVPTTWRERLCEAYRAAVPPVDERIYDPSADVPCCTCRDYALVLEELAGSCEEERRIIDEIWRE
ncbi:hypothetical protein EXIGLDRAFT_836457 [Exidia glandulosa HHB12029]|uniref:BTB domain-containing protein n=1 Tax=Exidia glandulosa HHB12029 TaxID=1314781 RepID=A0A165HTX9_EXIGL|nr:hypothetical protein EXIGLDRAFT_836457 [Exidia glandulosa HHB12029]